MYQTIRPATPNDHPAMESLWEASVRATHHFLEEKDITDIKRKLPAIFNSLSCYVTGNDSMQVTGMLGVTDDLIAMLFVHPAAFKNGVGRLLMNYATGRLKLRKVEVNEQNEAAAGFYEHLGFMITGRREVDDEGRPFPILEMTLSQ